MKHGKHDQMKAMMIDINKGWMGESKEFRVVQTNFNEFSFRVLDLDGSIVCYGTEKSAVLIAKLLNENLKKKGKDHANTIKKSKKSTSHRAKQAKKST